MVMRIDGCASLLCFRHFVPIKIKLVETEGEDDLQIDRLVQQIRSEATAIPKETDYDLSCYNLTDTIIERTGSTLLTVVSRLVSKGKVTKVSVSLTQSIQRHITRNPNQTTLGLATKIHHKFGSRVAIYILHEFGYTASYEEVIRFRNSAAKFVGEQGFSAMGLSVNGGLIGVWCDNYDLNVYTPNGAQETHAMAIEFTQQATENSFETPMPKTPRLSKTEVSDLKLSELSPVEFAHYQGSKNPTPPTVTVHEGQSLDEIMRTEESVASAAKADLEWLIKVTENDRSGEANTPE